MTNWRGCHTYSPTTLMKKHLLILIVLGFVSLNISDIVAGQFSPYKYLFWLAGVGILGAAYFVFFYFLIRADEKAKDKD